MIFKLLSKAKTLVPRSMRVLTMSILTLERADKLILLGRFYRYWMGQSIFGTEGSKEKRLLDIFESFISGTDIMHFDSHSLVQAGYDIEMI